MTDRPVIRRPRADQDVREAVAYYRTEAGEGAALTFIVELQKAFRHVGRHPATGSERYAHDLSLMGLRHWPVGRYPYLIFYTEGDGFVDVWRILHGKRDLPAEWARP